MPYSERERWASVKGGCNSHLCDCIMLGLLSEAFTGLWHLTRRQSQEQAMCMQQARCIAESSGGSQEWWDERRTARRCGGETMVGHDGSADRQMCHNTPSMSHYTLYEWRWVHACNKVSFHCTFRR